MDSFLSNGIDYLFFFDWARPPAMDSFLSNEIDYPSLYWVPAMDS